MVAEADLLQWTTLSVACVVLSLAVNADVTEADDVRSQRFSVREQLPAGSPVGTIRPRNVDEAQSDRIDFTLRESSPHRDYFDVDRRSGRLFTRVVIDREALCPHHPAACTLDVDVVVGPRRFFDILRVVVDVLDVNEHRPTFARRSTAVTLTRCDGLVTVRLPAADDADGGASPSYHVQSSPVAASLDVVRLFDGSHDLRLQLDGASVARRRSVTLLVVASDDADPPLTDVLQVHLVAACVDELRSTPTITHITSNVDHDDGDDDDDDDELRFVNATYHVTISESTPVGTTLLQVRAVSRGHLDDVITYGLWNRSATSTMFAINRRTGELSLRGHVMPRRRSATFRLAVTATSAAAAPLPVYADVIVRVGADDQTPAIVICDGCRHAATVSEDSPPETLVAVVFISSRDHPVACSMMTSSPFSLRRATDDVMAYRLLTSSSVDREVQSTYQLRVDCRSTSTGSTTTVTWSFIDVTVNDVNDNRPQVLTQSPVEVTIDDIYLYSSEFMTTIV